MIRISKGTPPKEWADKGKHLADADKLEFDKNPKKYLDGENFRITDHYKAEIAKKTLVEKQYNKCCFSEAKFTGDFPHVEHFRPKGRVDLLNSKTQLFPGYYWLAYEWSNLFLCKELINCSYKRNFFPLVDETKRNRSHHDTNIEDSLIIDPSLEDPRNHIRFHNEEPAPITPKGQFNIIFLKLRHPSFVEDRRKRFAELQALKNLVDIGVSYGYTLNDPLLSDSVATLRASVKRDAEFSSMAIDLLQGWPHL